MTPMPPPPMPIPPIMMRSVAGLALGTERSATPPRDPIASSSSMKITAPPYLSDLTRAFLNRRRTLRLPIPRNMFENPEPVADRNGTPDAPAIALAISVLPVPGGPSNRMPCGG